MKKAGSSKSKSKTLPSSKSTDTDSSWGRSIAIGHEPASPLSPQDEALFRSFQSNLLSLVSHELRTPLMGILNALSILEEAGTSDPKLLSEWMSVARKNAQRLHQSLDSLLDLAALESGNFHARLQEIDLVRWLQAHLRNIGKQYPHVSLQISKEGPETPTLILADPQRLGRLLDLLFHVMTTRTGSKQLVKFRISSNRIWLHFSLAEGQSQLWDQDWSQALAAFQGGVSSPSSAFSGVLQSEEAFLARKEEGLGNEFLLLHELVKLHRAQWKSDRQGSDVRMEFDFPILSSEETLQAVLSSRSAPAAMGQGSFALVVISTPTGLEVEQFRKLLQERLFRTRDAAYVLLELKQVALVLEDCKVEDVPKLLSRLQKNLKLEFHYGVAHCPEDTLDSKGLLEIARNRLRKER